MAPLFEGSFLLLFVLLLTVSEAVRSAPRLSGLSGLLRCVRGNSFEPFHGSGCCAAGQSHNLGFVLTRMESLEGKVKINVPVYADAEQSLASLTEQISL